MVAHFREGTSASVVADAIHQVKVGVEADERAAPLAPVVSALLERGDTLAAQKRAAERATGATGARVRTADALWDQAIAYVANGLREPGTDRAIEAAVFGDDKPSTITKYGFERELERGEQILAVLRRYPAVAERFAARIEARQGALSAAVEAHTASTRALFGVRADEALYVADVNRELDRIEGRLVELFAGERTMVNVLLAPLRTDRPRTKAEPAPTT